MRVPPSLIVNLILPCVRFLRSSDAAQEYLEQGVNVPEKQRLAKQEVCVLKITRTSVDVGTRCHHVNIVALSCGHDLNNAASCHLSRPNTKGHFSGIFIFQLHCLFAL